MAGSFETFGLPKSVHQQPIDPLAPLGSSQAPPAPSHSNMNVMYHSQHGPTFASFVDTSFLTDVSLETSQKISTIQQKLDKKLGPEFVSQRPGPAGGPKLTYAEGWKIIGLANEVFGFNGWSSHVVSLTTDYIDYNEETRRYNVGVTALVKVTLRDGIFHEDVGYGMLDNSRSKGAALDKVCISLLIVQINVRSSCGSFSWDVRSVRRRPSLTLSNVLSETLGTSSGIASTTNHTLKKL